MSRFTPYRCTKSATCTVTSVFAMGYAISAVLAPLRIPNSHVPKPWREADRGTVGAAAPPVRTPAHPNSAVWLRLPNPQKPVFGARVLLLGDTAGVLDSTTNP